MMIDEYPMLFELTNTTQKKSTHCGVLEFVAPEGHVYLPYWMMQNLLLTEGDIVKFQYTTLLKGKYVKLRPQTKDFLDISNPKAVLETTLRTYTCLTVGDSILINYNNKRYYVDIVEAKPNNAVCIVDTDCEVDFAPPLDYVEPVYEKKPAPKAANNVGSGGGDGAAASSNGGGGRGGGGGAGDGGKGKEPEAAAPVADSTPKFLAFGGSGNRLDGKSQRDLKPVEVELPTTSLNIPKEFEQFIRGPKPEGGAHGDEKKKESTSGSGVGGSTLPRRKAGKLVFGGTRGAEKAAADEDAAKKPAAAAAEQPKKEESKFKAFQGTGNKLR